MKEVSSLSPLGWMAVGIIYCTGALKLGLGNPNDPGPGFFPFLMSGIIIFFSAVCLLSSLRKRKESNSTDAAISWPDWSGWKRILFTVTALFTYIFALDYLGFIITTFLFVFLELRFIIPQKWITCIVGAGLATLISYGIFELWLKVQMPVGPLGF